MALLTSQQVSSLSVGLLSRSLVLPNTVSRIPGNEFSGMNGDTITVRTSVPGTAREQATPGATITYDAISEVGVDVTLSHLYHATRVTDEMLTYELVDFGAQVSAVQMDAVARGAEDELADVMNGLASDADFAASPSDADTIGTLLEARQLLGEANVPAGDRFLAVSSDIATRLLTVEGFRSVEQAGSATALRDATVGRLYGFTIVESNALDAGTAVAYHRSGFVFANRAPVVPRGASDSATATVGGVSLRHIFQYQPDILSDASVVSTFAGAAVVDANRVVKITTAA
jgi:N4-gp56 family major capsid protein